MALSNEDVVRRYLNAYGDFDLEAQRELRHQNFVLKWPQTRETVEAPEWRSEWVQTM